MKVILAGAVRELRPEDMVYQGEHHDYPTYGKVKISDAVWLNDTGDGRYIQDISDDLWGEVWDFPEINNIDEVAYYEGSSTFLGYAKFD